MIHKWDICGTILTLSKALGEPTSAPPEPSSLAGQRSPHACAASPGLLPNVTLTATTNNEKTGNVVVFIDLDKNHHTPRLTAPCS